MLSDEEKEILINIKEYMQNDIDKGYHKFVYNDLGSDFKCIDCINAIDNVLNLIEKQSEEIEELKETLKCTQNSWFEDTQKIEEMKKQIDLDNECEIALNSKVMDLEKEIEELKEKNKTLKNLQNDTNKLYTEMIERKNYFERELQKLENKIKAKIEEVHYKMIGHPDVRMAVELALQSLLEKE